MEKKIINLLFTKISSDISLRIMEITFLEVRLKQMLTMSAFISNLKEYSVLC